MDKTWKRRERQIAKYFGTRRTPLSGSNSGHKTSSDSLHPTLYVEAKTRKKHTAVSLWMDTNKKALKENKIPVVCLAENGKKGFYVLVHSSDLIAVANQRVRAKADNILAKDVENGEVAHG